MCSGRGEEEANRGGERLPIKNVRSSRIKEFGGREVPSSVGERKDRKRGLGLVAKGLWCQGEGLAECERRSKWA